MAEDGTMNKVRVFTLASAVGAVVVIAAQQVQAATVFLDGFENGVPGEIGGAGILADAFGGPELGLGNFFVRNTTSSPTTLTLGGLPAHDSIDLSFTFAAIDSWDGSETGPSPDFFNVNVDGASIFRETFDNFNPRFQSYIPPTGTLLTPRLDTGTSFSPFANLGFESRFGDSVYTFSFVGIPQTANTLTIDWFANGAGFQGGSDESFAIDNITVSLNGGDTPAVPEPSMILGSVALSLGGIWRRLKQKRA